MDWSWLNATTDEISTFGPASEREVIEAELQIGSFPSEYREFVLACGSARILGDEIFGVHAELPQHMDVVQLSKKCVDEWGEEVEGGKPMSSWDLGNYRTMDDAICKALDIELAN